MKCHNVFKTYSKTANKSVFNRSSRQPQICYIKRSDYHIRFPTKILQLLSFICFQHTTFESSHVFLCCVFIHLPSIFRTAFLARVAVFLLLPELLRIPLPATNSDFRNCNPIRIYMTVITVIGKKKNAKVET